MDETRIPVIAAIGEWVDRPADPATALEPVDLAARAIRACEADAGAALVGSLDLVSLVGLVSWRYRDPAGLLGERLGATARTVNASMGGETPVRLIHAAALRIAGGEDHVAAVVGAEAAHAAGRARAAGVTPPWTAPSPPDETVRFPSSRFAMSAVARRLGADVPTAIYPFYEVAFDAAQGLTPAAAHRANAALWARYAAVAASNPAAWLRSAPDPATIAAITPANRLIAWPYPKLMTANPAVNQAAATVVTSLARARRLGVAADRLIHLWGGGQAIEPEDYLHRDRYDRSAAQAAALDRAVAVAGGDAGAFRHFELYSCFPVVPRMALAHLRLDPAVPPTVAGGLTFFGGPLNNYMGHAAAAMVRALRADPGALGLLYGQGGYVNKHATLVLSTAPPPAPLASDPSVQAAADAARGPAPPLVEDYAGPAMVETYTVLFGRDGAPQHGIVIARTPANVRLMACVSDADSITRMTNWDHNEVGATLRVVPGADHVPTAYLA